MRPQEAAVTCQASRPPFSTLLAFRYSGGEAGTAAAAIQAYGAFIAGGGNSGTSGWPKGWLNMLVFDKDFNLVDLAFEQLDGAYMQPIGNVNKLPCRN